ncbi:MAG: hypothetical protein EOP41_05780 [Sphingobacteriaceae bacterium]|nr:MAG: hypothetical protein EOP41_05780 [Sphingobacteriaceae bacterium]
MNKRKAPVILSWLLLLFFAVGQIMVFAHQHHAKYSLVSVHHNHFQHPQIIHEKCNFCDQMHHTVIDIVDIPNYGIVLTPVFQLYTYAKQHYLGNALVHADGLSPPVLS